MYNEIMLKLKYEILKFRKGIKPKDIAGICGVSRQTVYNWLCGRNRPTAKHLEKLKILAK